MPGPTVVDFYSHGSNHQITFQGVQLILFSSSLAVLLVFMLDVLLVVSQSMILDEFHFFSFWFGCEA